MKTIAKHISANILMASILISPLCSLGINRMIITVLDRIIIIGVS